MKRVQPNSPPAYAVNPANGDIRIRPRKKLLERGPVTAGRNEAFDLLHERLAVATEFFQHHGDAGRVGVYRAMGDIIEYLTSRGIPRATLRPFEAVMAAIVDADNGTASAIFAPDRKGKQGTPPKPVEQRSFEGLQAAVMECCVRHSKAEGQWPFVEPAAQLAAKMINGSDWGIRVTARELEELRERVQQHEKGLSPRLEVDILLSGEVARSRPLEFAQLLIAHQWVNPPAKFSG